MRARREMHNAVQETVLQIVGLVAPLRVVLFGSRARGTENSASDVDFCVVISPDRSRKETARILYRELHAGGLDFDILVATEDDLEKGALLPGTVYRDILRDGKTLYVA
ncbi:MAG TPA: nucleotidyltransferase domain-containing protein [Spirochaetota bacterium]|nr:nucleotidyltransferase domain-containing protein [Spirochaetota bacterium]HPN83083.1 nucleotidyltransferase domain-containing protein [Spirochaetota bacterium]